MPRGERKLAPVQTNSATLGLADRLSYNIDTYCGHTTYRGKRKKKKPNKTLPDDIRSVARTIVDSMAYEKGKNRFVIIYNIHTCREAGIDLLFICGSSSSSRPLELIFIVSIMSVWVEPRALLAC